MKEYIVNKTTVYNALKKHFPNEINVRVPRRMHEFWKDALGDQIDYEDAGLLLDLMYYMRPGDISDAMRDYADTQGIAAAHFACGVDSDGGWLCSCGGNCGDDDDCFACCENDNLYNLTWVIPEEVEE